MNHSRKTEKSRRLVEKLRTMRSVKLSNEEYDKSVNKLVGRIADPPPRVEFTIRVDINVHSKHEARLECMLTSGFLDKMSYQHAPMQPYTISPITDTGAQANIIGAKHLAGMGIDVCSLHPTRVTMDCANSFFGYILARGQGLREDRGRHHQLVRRGQGGLPQNFRFIITLQ